MTASMVLDTFAVTVAESKPSAKYVCNQRVHQPQGMQHSPTIQVSEAL